jgi:hypothetical protein
MKDEPPKPSLKEISKPREEWSKDKRKSLRKA